MNSNWTRIADGYKAAAVVLLNCGVAFVLLNAGACVGLTLLDRGSSDRGPLSYDAELLRQAYPGRPESEIRELLEETWSREYVYEPFTQFREDEISGRYVNIHPAGFRSTGRDEPWPPSSERFNVFFFGGSTGFGYGLPDDETIPARLGAALRKAGCGRVAVYNFARSNYFSSQERALFSELLAAGHVPDLAVFLDGLNEFHFSTGEPKYTRRLRYLMAESHPRLVRRALLGLPLTRLLRRFLASGDRDEAGLDASARPAGEVLDRWRRNRELIRALAESRGVETLFVWQPIPVYGEDRPENPFLAATSPLRYERSLDEGYRRLDEARSKDPELALERRFLWLADRQPDDGSPLYVDRVHYSAAFSRRLADEIAGVLQPSACRPLD